MNCIENIKGFIKDSYEKDKLFFLFCAVSSVFLLIFVLSVFITKGDALYSILGRTHGDYFEDHFYSVLAAYYYPYSIEHVIYPPLTVIVYAIIGQLTVPYTDVPLGDASTYFYILRDSQMSLVIYFLMLIIVLFVLYNMCLHKDNTTKTKLIFFFFMVSYSVVFSIERSNNIPIVLMFCLFFVLFYRSENRILRVLAILSLAIATNIKLYPLIMIVLYLRERDFKALGWCLAATVFLFLFPFIFTDGNPVMLLNNLTHTSGDNLGYPGLTGIHKYLMAPLVGIVPNSVLSIVGYVLALAIGAVFICIVMFDKKMEYWKMLLLVICACIFGPSIAATEYMMMFLLIPLLYLFEEKRKFSKMNIIYVVLFALGFVLMPGYTVPFLDFDAQIIMSGTKAAFLEALAVLCFVEGCYHLYKQRKETKDKASADQ